MIEDKNIRDKIKELGPPLPPPNRDIKIGLFEGKETKESKKRQEDYLEYLKRYEEQIENIKKEK